MLYPLTELGRQHSQLAHAYLPDDRMSRSARATLMAGKERFDALRRSYAEKFYEQLRATDSAVISSEHLSLLSSDEIQRLRIDLETAGFRDVRVVVYVRDPADYYLSQTQEILKASSRIPDPASFRYGFRDIITSWETVFPGQLLVRHLRGESGFDVVEDFSEILRHHFGVSLSAAPSRLNVTISAEGMEILQRYRSTFCAGLDDVWTPATTRLIWFLHASLSDLPQSRPALRPEIAETIRRNHLEDAEFLASRYGVDLQHGPTHGFPPLPRGRTWRVAEILRECDPELVTDLLLRAARTAFDRDPPMAGR